MMEKNNIQYEEMMNDLFLFIRSVYESDPAYANNLFGQTKSQPLQHYHALKNKMISLKANLEKLNDDQEISKEYIEIELEYTKKL